MNTATVFVVDDDPGMRRALTRLFESAGRRVEAFESARAFLERPPHRGVGCLVLDLQMPDMSGPELQGLMAEKGIAVPVVFLTGHGDVPSSVEAMKKGAVDFLLKPVEDEVLLRAVESALARHAAGSERQALRQAILERLARLSPRQREVMRHVIQGRLNKQIAADLNISLKTVKTHRGRVMATMEYGSVAELVRACELAGIEPGVDQGLIGGGPGPQ
jgi:FixJ family two-component response regulator